MDPKIDDLLSSDQQAEYKRVGFNYSPLDISTMVNILERMQHIFQRASDIFHACFRVYLEWRKHYGMCVVCLPLHAFKGPGGLAWLTNYLLDTTSTAPLFTTNRPTMWVLRSILLVRNHPHTIIHAYILIPRNDVYLLLSTCGAVWYTEQYMVMWRYTLVSVDSIAEALAGQIEGVSTPHSLP